MVVKQMEQLESLKSTHQKLVTGLAKPIMAFMMP